MNATASIFGGANYGLCGFFMLITQNLFGFPEQVLSNPNKVAFYFLIVCADVFKS
jgi:hypothetical protein